MLQLLCYGVIMLNKGPNIRGRGQPHHQPIGAIYGAKREEMTPPPGPSRGMEVTESGVQLHVFFT